MGQRLEAARYMAGYSVRGLADRLDVGKNSITAWERGTLPSAETRAKLAALYDITEDVLFAEVAAQRADAEELLRPA
jgi:transcriptional regulator with XRE-family HTH domain